MSRPADFREKILKEGVLKYRQSTIALPRWKARYVVFKISGGGRLQFIIYRDQPTSPANEIKEIPIEEFGGLESSLKLDNEKFVFYVITTGVTDCFSTESADELKEWTTLLQEYLGKELTFNITIPHKQSLLKSGKGVLRIRNTGFTITTSDNPPRCLGTWQIIHIRKFGGSESFRFQTGSKCPTGEFLYTIQTDDNARVKSLFNDLSQHKPIFSDDRVGRRMTLERNHYQQMKGGGGAGGGGGGGGGHQINRASPSRFSLQSMPGKEGRDSPAPMYENKQVITDAVQRRHMSSRDVPPPLPPNRRHSVNDERTFHPLVHGVQQRSSGAAPLSPASAEDQRTYQNIRGPHAGPSPSRRSNRYPVVTSEPVPEGYYNVSPPLALKKYRNSSSSPTNLSSPEEETFLPECAPVPPPPITFASSAAADREKETYAEGYFRFAPPVALKVEGDNLVVQRLYNGGGGEGEGKMRASVAPSKEEASMYQNLDFMSKRPGVVPTTANVYAEDLDDPNTSLVPGPAHPSCPVPEMETEWIHNYTNVDFALEAAHRLSRKSPRKTPASGSSEQQARAGDVKRKVSAPPLSRDRSGAMSYTGPDAPPQNTSTLLPAPHPKIKASLSSHDLKHHEKQQQHKLTQNGPLPEYYNLFVPHLPAMQPQPTKSLESQIRNTHATLSSFPVSSDNGSAAVHESVTKTDGVDEVDLHEGPMAEGETVKTVENFSEDEDDKVLVRPDPVYAMPTNTLEADGVATKTLASHYDHLELRGTSGTLRFSPVPSPSPESQSRGNTPRPSNYDQLIPKESSPKPQSASERRNSSQSASPEPIHASQHTGYPLAYERKVQVVGHTHNYEYIDVELHGGQQGSHGQGLEAASSSLRISAAEGMESESNTGNELPSQWLSPTEIENRPIQSKRESQRRSPNTQPRRRHLPLQTTPLDESFSNADEDSPENSLVESAEQKPVPKPRKSRPSSASSSELASSGEMDAAKPPSPQLSEESSSPSQHRVGNEALMTGAPPTSKAANMTVDPNAGEGTAGQPGTQKVPKVPPKQKQRSDSPVTSVNGDPSTHPPAERTHSHPSPTVPPKLSKLLQKGYQSLDENPPLPPRPKDQAGFTVSLPVTDFQFEKPLVPPKPRVLAQKPGVQYAAMQFAPAEMDNNYTQVLPKTKGSSVKSGTGRNTERVVYQSIDFEVTEGLRRTKVAVEDQRNREIRWIEQHEKAIAANCK